MMLGSIVLGALLELGELYGILYSMAVQATGLAMFLYAVTKKGTRGS